MRSATASTRFDCSSKVLVEQKMELIEGRAGYLPVRLLVKITKGDRVGKQLIEAFRHFQSHGFFQFERKHVTDCAVCLNFGSSFGEAAAER